jgi:hypothetical protein
MKNFIAALTITFFAITAAFTTTAFSQEPEVKFTREQAVVVCATSILIVVSKHIDNPNPVVGEAFRFYVKLVAEYHDLTQEQALDVIVEVAEAMQDEEPLVLFVFAGECITQYESLNLPKGISV